MMGRHLAPLGLVVAVFLFACPSIARPVSAQARSLAIEQFDAEVVVAPTGVVHVTEAIRFHFTGSWNGGFRDIPVLYETPQGFNYNLALNVQSIVDAQGQPLEYEESREGRNTRIKIWVPGATDANRTVYLEYTVENALRFSEPGDGSFEAGYDEFYWNVTGDEWEVPINAATARVTVPPEVTGLEARVYTGPVGSSTTTDATAS